MRIDLGLLEGANRMDAAAQHAGWREGRDPAPWFSVESDFVLSPADDAREPTDPGRTA